MKFLFFAGGATVTGMEVALLSLMARLNAIGHRAVAVVSDWNDGAYPPMLDAAAASTATIPTGHERRCMRCARPCVIFAAFLPRCGRAG